MRQIRLPRAARISSAILVLSVAAVFERTAPHAQGWPTRPVHWIQSSAPGSSADIIGRILSDRLGAKWGVQIVSESRPGAAGNIAAQAAARAAPDGYNYFLTVASTLAVNPYTFKSLPFDVERDFVPVINIGISPFIIAVNSALPVNSTAELIAYAKARPGKLSFATSGARNLPQITGEMLKLAAGIDIVNVPYKGSPFAAQDTIAGRTEIYIDSVPAMSGHLGSDRLRILGVTSKDRVAGFENIPTVAEAVPGFSAVGWFALLAPAGTPSEALTRVNRDLNEILTRSEVRGLLHRNGVFSGGGTLEESKDFLRTERDRWQQAIQKAGIQPE